MGCLEHLAEQKFWFTLVVALRVGESQSQSQDYFGECGYYVMHWMSTIILGTFRNNWEAYFNDARPLEPERLKALRIQWAQFYLRVRDQA
ncbi:hypothetical protein HKD37_19G052905 [Glycine soja]